MCCSRHLSRAIEARTGVRHESPQVLVLRDGRAVWWASHVAISAAEVERPQVLWHGDHGHAQDTGSSGKVPRSGGVLRCGGVIHDRACKKGM